MKNPNESLIAAAVRPLADNAEMHLAAGNLLASVMVDSGKDGAEAMARWEAMDRKKGRRWAGILLWVAVFGIFAAVFAAEFRENLRLAVWAEWAAEFNMFSPHPEPSITRYAATLNDRDRLLLFGDLSRTTKAERMEALWRSEPANPAYFADYAAAYISDNSRLPPDFLTIARRIDPENSWFTYQAAAVEAKDVVKANSRKSKRVAGKTVHEGPKTWQILDQSRFDRTLDLLREAQNQLKFDSYAADLLRQRIPLIPQRTFAERIDSIGFLNSYSVSSSIRLRIVSDILAAKAMMVGDNKNHAEYLVLTTQAEHFLRGICGDSSFTLVDSMVANVVASVIAESLGNTAEKLDLPDDAQRWNAIYTRLKERADRRSSRKLIVDGKAVPEGERVGYFLGNFIEMVAKQAENQPAISDADLEPSRLFDHEFLSRIFSYALWILLLPCVIAVFCHRFCVSALSRRLGRRMEDLLQISDRVWIVGLGVMLPFFYVMAVNRLTPLGGREMSVAGTTLLLPLAHFLGLWLLWLVVPVRVVRWRLWKRAGCFGFGGSSWFDWLAVVSAAAFVPLIGWALLAGSSPNFWQTWVEELGVMDERTLPVFPVFWVALGCAGFSLIWLAVAIFQTWLSRADQQFQRAAASSSLVKSCAWMLIVSSLAIPAFHAAEQQAYEQEKLMKLDPEGPGWSVFESRVAAQARQELRAVMGYED